MTTKITDPSGRTIELTRGADGDVHVLSRHSAGHVVLIGPLDPTEVRRALDAECPGEAETPQPAQTGKPTAEDFARARFAVHPDGAWAARLEEDHLPWIAMEGAGMDHTLSDAAMADGGWQIVTPAPTTARDLLAMLPDLCHEPEDGKIPKDTGLIEVWDDGDMRVVPEGYICGVAVHGTEFRRLLLDPPAPKRPEWADADWVWAETETGARVIWEHLTGDPGDEWWAWGDRTLRLDEMAERRPVPVAPEEVKA